MMQQKNKAVELSILCVFSKKKIRTFYNDFAEYCKKQNIPCQLLELNKNGTLPTSSGNILLHKITDDLCSLSDSEAQQRVIRLQEYLEQHPELIVVEDLQNIHKVLNRKLMYETLSNVWGVAFPKYCIIENKQDLSNINHIQFPVICKSLTACGTNDSHGMAICFNEKSLKNIIMSDKINLPVVVQQFINHDGVVHKIYVVGSQVWVQHRESIKNLSPGTQDAIIFNSQDKLPESLRMDVKSNQKTPLMPMKLVSEITKSIKKLLGFGLFGYDVVTDVNSQKHYIIDVNYFPGYKNISNFHENLIQYLSTKVLNKRT